MKNKIKSVCYFLKKLFILFVLFCISASYGITFAQDAVVTGTERDAIFADLPENILYIVRPQYQRDHHNTATLFQKGEYNAAKFTGGSALRVWNTKTDSVHTLIELPDGIIRDPTLSFDATKVLFSFRKSKDDDYHLGELVLDLDRPVIRITAESMPDVSGLRQLTSLPGVSDVDPIYLPTGEIVFASTREPKYCMCNRHIMCNLFIMNSDGSNIQQIGKSTLFEGHPSLLSDGRILYDRWEYVDRNFGDAQGVWVCNPDGSKHEIFWGNNTAAPGAVIDARIMPESDSKMVCVFSSCHDQAWGAIALVDRRLGIDGRDSVLMTWPAIANERVTSDPGPDPFREVRKYDAMRELPRKYEDPFPVNDRLILASGQTGQGENMGIWALTTDGKEFLLHKDTPGCYDPTPWEETEMPMTIAPRVDWNDDYGYFHVTNVYEGFGMEKVAKGSVKYLRVVESPEKRFWTVPHYSHGNGQQAPAMAWDDFNNKRILGTVPVLEDGSVSVKVPAERFLYFQLLDENGMMIQSMRSGIITQPGETNACVGCHESRLDAPASLNFSPMSRAQEPQSLTPWHGEERMFSYLTEVQPVFERYCIGCHDYGQMAEDKLILAGDRCMLFNKSYEQIRSKNLVCVPGAGPHNKFEPYTWGSTKSRLVEVLRYGHGNEEIDRMRKEKGVWFDPQADPESLDRVVTWIDINAPYYPDYGTPFPEHPHGRSPLTEEQTARLIELVGRKDLMWDVSFDRPDKSPCLKKWDTDEQRQSAEYQEALAIITAGQTVLSAAASSERSTGPLNPRDVQFEQRYQAMKARLEHARKAQLKGERVYD